MRSSILRYIALPEIKPRLENLLTSGFQFIAYYIALIYGAVKLLPASHAYLNPQNIGHFGIHHVIAEAANNLTFNKKNIDQIVMFSIILLGLGLLVAQIGLLIMGLTIQPVFAAASTSIPTTFAGFFITKNPDTDIAFMMMDAVFGVSGTDGKPGFFNSCIAQGIDCVDNVNRPVQGEIGPYSGQSVMTPLGQSFPFPIHEALHGMFALYSTGLLLVATFISIYFMITVVAETAQTGTAFGKRFNKVWAPIRIVMAFGLLVPLGAQGLNTSQYIVLYAAKLGSSFATNGWVLFNEELSAQSNAAMQGLFGTGEDLAASPNIPEFGALLEFMFVSKTCFWLHWHNNPKQIMSMYAVRGPAPTGGGDDSLAITSAAQYDAVIQFAAVSGSKKVVFSFGDKGDEHKTYLGSVMPYCGQIVMNLTDPKEGAEQDPAAKLLQQEYFRILVDLWRESVDQGGYPESIAKKHLEKTTNQPAPPPSFKSDLQKKYSDSLREVLKQAKEVLKDSPRFNVETALVNRGWAGAAIWYNKIAEMNGALTTAVFNIPLPSQYPYVMEQIQHRKKIQDRTDPSPKTRFEPKTSDGRPIVFKNKHDAIAAGALWEAFSFWTQGDHAATPHTKATGNAMIDAINALFGTEGLYNIRNNTDTHPLAQLVSVGRGLVEASIRNLTIAVAGGASGLLANMVDKFIGKTISVASTFLVTVAMVGLTAGFVLFYVVPFLPFIYFFFALGGWVKGIFEAMVGAPLWALAHIRIDGEGLTGQAAVSGYFLIFEIFLRPILMIFGILASISIFSGLVSVLNQIFDLVVSNLGGFDYSETDGPLEFARGAIDNFFFTLIYTIIIYLMALSSFKLIDLIPNNILRWMGQSVSTFNDQREDAAQSLVGKSTVGAQQASSALGGGLQGIAKAAG